MQSYFDSFAKILHKLKKSEHDQIIQKEIVENLDKIFQGMNNCSSKIFSAAKFIEYFVNDILDYSMLNKDEKNFIKDLKVYDIKQAI
jgi:hypothetical protein